MGRTVEDKASEGPMRRSSGYPRCDPSTPRRLSVVKSSLNEILARVVYYYCVWVWKVVSSLDEVDWLL